MAAATIAMDTLRQRKQWDADTAMAYNRQRFATELRARRGPTPEVYFDKRLDNSRLVKADDPQRGREMRNFAVAAVVFFALLMTYTWQHYRSVELGYQVEAQKMQLEHLQEQARQLGLVEAQLTQPERMDRLARQMGMDAPQPGQFVTPGLTDETPSGPLLAQVAVPDATPSVP